MSQEQSQVNICITFPDGRNKEYATGTTGLEIAMSISPGLAKKCVAISINEGFQDLSMPINSNSSIALITRESEDGLEVIRHDMAHIMAQAVKDLYPETKVSIGPAIANGFYYDFFREKAFTPDDLIKIEKRMHEIVDRDIPIVRHEWTRDDAIKHFKKLKESFKVEIIEDIPGDQTISFYEQADFIDLCRGPHLPSTKNIGHAFKLTRLAGAYWRGDHRNDVMQRIYGTGWATEKDLKTYLVRLEEAEKRDHRKIGPELELFHLQEEAVGSVFWHPKGWQLYRGLETYLRGKLDKQDYKEVKTPQILDRKLWEKSGHWDKFRENMFIVEDDDKKTLAIKPMNCPGHVQIFKQGLKSYRDLPLRMSEFGSCHRNEPSGALHGIMRVRAFTQDDAHIFCTPAQIVSETKLFCDLLQEVYKDLGFDKIEVKLSDRPEVRAGEDSVWDNAEKALIDAADQAGLTYTLNPGEGAFYGPKLEFVLVDAIGREWQCGTLQVDFVLPERLDASYIGEDGNKHRPVMLHRAILGSFERFLGILIEHYAGKFPVWLAPVQVAVTTITSNTDSYATNLAKTLKGKGIRVVNDIRNEKISYKVREHSLKKIPYIITVGDKEMADGTVSVRRLGEKHQKVMSLDEFMQELETASKVPE